MSEARPKRWRGVWQALIGLWIVAVLLGMNALWRYESAAGAAASAPARWPEGTHLALAADRPTLLLFAHPHCTCTRASLTELEWLVSRHRDAVNAQVVFLQPSGAGDDWTSTDTYRRAGNMQGVQRTLDRDGSESRRFGAATSGQALLYDAGGELLFSGGITGARGHEGDNLGRARVAALLLAQEIDRAQSPVFGCELEGPRSL